VRADTVRLAWDGRGAVRINGVLLTAEEGVAGTESFNRLLALRAKTGRAFEDALLAGRSRRVAAEEALLVWTAGDRALLDGEPSCGEGVIELRFAGRPREMWILSSEGSRVPRRFSRDEAIDLGERLVRALGETGLPNLTVIGYGEHFLSDSTEVRRAGEQISGARGGRPSADGPLPLRELDLFRAPD
jgi:hypothetical protein